MSNSNTLLKGKKVIVIGGSSGIGRGVAAASLANGASVVIASSTQSKVDAAVELLQKGIIEKEVTVSGEVFDVKDFPALIAFLGKHAPFDHFISTAGEAPRGHASELSAEVDIREQLKGSMDSRYWALMNAANYIHKHKLIRPGGSFTMTIGTAQKRPIPGFGFFIGTAGAIETATRGLAVDLKPLRVNTISPGLVDTPLIQHFPEEVRTGLFESHREKIPVGHVGTPEEVAEAYIFAMKCQYLTGQVIIVDGGGVLV